MGNAYTTLILVVVLNQLFVFSVIAVLIWDRFNSRKHIARLQAEAFEQHRRNQ